jgi:hypothetical protein
MSTNGRQTRNAVNSHTTLIMDGKKPVRVENDGHGDEPVDDAAQWLGHPLECSDPVKGKGGIYTYRVWFNEDCGCEFCS